MKKKKVSKQDKWARGKLLQGLCMTCGKEPVIVKKSGIKGKRCRVCLDKINVLMNTRNKVKKLRLALLEVENV